MRTAALTSLTRFGLGPRPGERARVAADPRGHVLAQLERPADALLEGLGTTAEVMARYIAVQGEFQDIRRALRDAGGGDQAELEAAAQMRGKAFAATHAQEIGARFAKGATTDTPFLERLVLFWSNHFAVESEGAPGKMISGAYERNAIRPHVLGRFEDLLAAATLHPAMLAYLDNNGSIGANSPLGRRRGVSGPNENLGREVLELHTLGAGGGYTQADVVALANTLTGWVGGLNPVTPELIFDERRHEAGPREILGRRYAVEGEAQVRAVLADLAVHPSTARHLAGKFARHFVADAAPAGLVERLERNFLETGGDLKAFAATLAADDAAWEAAPAKVVPPYDFMVSSCRALSLEGIPDRVLQTSARDLGQTVWDPPSPAGWPDEDHAFLGGDSLLERIDFAQLVADRFGTVADVRALAADLVGDDLDPVVSEAVLRAEDAKQATVLLLLSPAFQRR